MWHISSETDLSKQQQKNMPIEKKKSSYQEIALSPLKDARELIRHKWRVVLYVKWFKTHHQFLDTI